MNGVLPGPEIRYREGDMFRVTVNNRLTVPTSVHWHGMIVPNYMDGVPGVTQAPMAPNASVFYEYPLRQTGTYWYHSHYQLQEQTGLAGPLIIEARDEPHSYDRRRGDLSLRLARSAAGIRRAAVADAAAADRGHQDAQARRPRRSPTASRSRPTSTIRAT